MTDRLALLFSFIFFCNFLFAQKLPIPEALTMEDGLCFRNVTSIVQDHQGLLWFGTHDGLSRFDGYRFINFGNGPLFEEYFPANDFDEDALLFLNDSTLWAITNGQLFAMNTNTFKSSKVEGWEGKAFKMIPSKNGGVLMVTNHEGEHLLWYFSENGGFEKIASAPQLQLGLTDLDIDNDGHFWWSTMANGLQEFSPSGELLNEIKLDSFQWNGSKMYYSDLFIDSQNRFFFFSRRNSLNHEVWQYLPTSGKKKLVVGGMENIEFVAYEDTRGDLWFRKEGGMFQLRKDGQIIDYSRALHLSLDFAFINAIYEDRSNVLWIATDGGLLKLPVRKQLFENSFNKDGAGWGNGMRGISEDESGDLFFFCEMGSQGLHRMDRNSGRINKLDIKVQGVNDFDLLGQAYAALFDAKQKCLWTLNKDLLKIDLKGEQVEAQTAISFDIDAPDLNPLALLPNGELLVGKTLEKLSLYNSEKREVTSLLEDETTGYKGIITTVFLAQGNDSLWVGTRDKGLFLFNRNGSLLNHFHLGSQPALSSDHIICLYLDKKYKTLWVGTFGGGINGLKPQAGEVEVFNQKKGLPNNNVASILGDDLGNLWLGTYNGLSCFNKKEKTFRNFYEEDGLSHNEFNSFSAFKSSKGKFHFGGLNGINSFYPKDLLKERDAPALQLTSFSRHNQNLDSLFEYKTNQSLKGPFTISPDISYFQFEWTLPHFIDLKKHQYFTWLEGLEEGWTPLGNSSKIRFNKLPPGEYILHLKGKDSQGNWNVEPLALPIKVLPPWWKTWWAYSLFLLSTIAVFGFIRRRELRRIKLQSQLEKEQLEATQLRELDEAKTRFFANLSHEFRTPLTVILGMAEEIEKPGMAKSLIQQSGQNLLRLVNQMLDFNKLEAGKLKLNLQSGDLVRYLQYIKESFHSLAEHKNLELTFTSEVAQLKMDFDEEKVQHIISNLLSNAIKFTPRDGKVALAIKPIGEGKLSVSVSDSGIGIAADQLPHIFERFFQVGDSMSKGEPGTGIGLAFSKELVELMGGTIEVESKVGTGSVFTVLLPLAKSIELGVRETESKIQSLPPISEESISSQPAQNPPLETQNSLLLIEDNPEVVAYIRNILQGQYDITVAENGQIGIEKAVELIPDIIISDVMMPVKDGFAVTDFLKNDERTSHIPIIMLTAKADAESRLEGLERGADAYLAKPFHKKELELRLMKLIELRQKLQARYAQFTLPEIAAPDKDTQIEDAFLKKINGIIEAHLSEAEFGVAELSREVGMSHSQLFRKLKALTSKSIVAYLRSARLHQAKTLLQKGGLNVSEVAYEVGFNDPAYFSRAFSKEFGFPPADLLK